MTTLNLNLNMRETDWTKREGAWLGGLTEVYPGPTLGMFARLYPKYNQIVHMFLVHAHKQSQRPRQSETETDGRRQTP